MYINYIIILILGCIDFFIHYKFVTNSSVTYTTKQKSFILSIKASLTLFLVGIYFNYFYIKSGCDEKLFLQLLDSQNNLNFGILIILYFTSYLLIDMLVGYYEYPEEMKSLSGNFHHKCYTIINMLSLYFGMYPIYLLHLLSEFPTFVRGIGSFDNKYRSNNLFGISFFVTRIVYHIYLTYSFKHHSLLFYCSITALSLHIYWFYGWWNKYGKKTIKKSKLLT